MAQEVDLGDLGPECPPRERGPLVKAGRRGIGGADLERDRKGESAS